MTLAGQDTEFNLESLKNKLTYFLEEVGELESNIIDFEEAINNNKDFDLHKLTDDLSDIQVTLNNLKIVVEDGTQKAGLVSPNEAYKIVSLNNQNKFLPDINFIIEVLNNAPEQEIEKVLTEKCPLTFYLKKPCGYSVFSILGFNVDNLSLVALNNFKDKVLDADREQKVNSSLTLKTLNIITLHKSLMRAFLRLTLMISATKTHYEEKGISIIGKENAGSISFLRVKDQKVMKPFGFVNLVNTTVVYKTWKIIQMLVDNVESYRGVSMLAEKNSDFTKFLAIILSNGGVNTEIIDSDWAKIPYKQYSLTLEDNEPEMVKHMNRILVSFSNLIMLAHNE